MRDATDPQLVASVRSGSSEAVTELFRRHWPTTWRAAYGLCGRRSLADDMAQDAFERAIARLETFNGASSFGTWVQRIAVNRTIDEMRREKRLGDLSDDLEDPVEWAERSQVDPVLMRAVGALSPERRVPVVLRYWFDYTPAEIAEVLGIPAGTIASRLSRALDELRDVLEAGDA